MQVIREELAEAQGVEFPRLGTGYSDEDVEYGPPVEDDPYYGVEDDPESFHQEPAQDQPLVELFSQRFNLSPQEAELMLKPGGKMDRVVGMMTSDAEWSNLSFRQQWSRMGKWIFGTGMNQ